ncbi:MAG: hypothetical protein JKY88_12660 [Pseudomonadales bacterium]|nr:hypothetical protein [Pseudomonadales bacterium]
MKKTYLLLIICLFAASTTIAQENIPPESRDKREILQDDFRNGLSKSIEDLSESAHAQKRKPALPKFAPKHWHHDYDYKVKFEEYLNEKFLSAQSKNKGIYIYLYADWLENCREFRKAANRPPLTALFKDNDIIMVEYNFFKRKFNMKAVHLPMIMKVNENSKFGPETVYPVAKANDHPRKVYHKLRKFFSQ